MVPGNGQVAKGGMPELARMGDRSCRRLIEASKEVTMIQWWHSAKNKVTYRVRRDPQNKIRVLSIRVIDQDTHKEYEGLREPVPHYGALRVMKAILFPRKKKKVQVNSAQLKFNWA